MAKKAKKKVKKTVKKKAKTQKYLALANDLKDLVKIPEDVQKFVYSLAAFESISVMHEINLSINKILIHNAMQIKINEIVEKNIKGLINQIEHLNNKISFIADKLHHAVISIPETTITSLPQESDESKSLN